MEVLQLLVAMLAASLSLPLIAQNEPTPPAACGDLQVSMAVKLDKAHPPQAQPETGKALVYFIQDRARQARLVIRQPKSASTESGWAPTKRILILP